MNDQSTFEFVLPTRIVFGSGIIRTLPEEIRGMNHVKPLIITDKGLVKAGIAGKITAVLEKENIQYSLFDGIAAESKRYNGAKGL